MSTGSETHGQVSARTLVIGLLAVLLFGGLLIVLAPRLLTPSAAPENLTPSPESAPTESTSKASAPAPPTAVDLTNPDLLRARGAAQELRDRFKQAAAQLEASQVSRWAPNKMEQASKHAGEAERAFDLRQFEQARQGYQKAVAITDELVAEIPTRLQAALEAGETAIEIGDESAANKQFELALALDTGNEQAQQGLARVQVMAQVQDKLSIARRMAQIEEFGSARRALQDALQLDPKSRQAAQQLATVDTALAEREFARVMGQTLNAIDERRYSEASQYLSRARQLSPNDPAVRDAGARIAAAQAESRLSGLRQEAQAQVEEENWAGAVAAYEAATKIDSTAGFARQGLAQARERAALDQQLEDYIRRPDRLQASAVREQATQTMLRAVAIDPRGPRLDKQIEGLRTALKAATTPVEVTLRSDRKTGVTIYRIGDQGRFDEKALMLKPGRYTVIGRRDGYRDVREEIEVKPGMQPVEIRATEPL